MEIGKPPSLFTRAAKSLSRSLQMIEDVYLLAGMKLERYGN